MMEVLDYLRVKNNERAEIWNATHPENHTDVAEILFRSNELGGECGELQNIVKKLMRQRLCMPTGEASVAELADEAGDVLICLDRLCAAFGVNLWEAAVHKFNKTSDKHGFPVKLEIEPPTQPVSREEG